MKSIFKKNQLMITALAIMIAIAGYLQFAGTGLDEEYLTVNDDNVYTGDSAGSGVITENYTADDLLDLSDEDLLGQGEIPSLDGDLDIIVDDYLSTGMNVAQGENGNQGETAQAKPGENEIPGEAVFTTTENVTVLSEAKLLKEQTRARNKATLLEIINSEGLTDAQKQEAVDTMVAMTAVAEKEAAAEILLEAKGFADVVVSINGDGVDVVVNASVLDDAQRAQIEDIVKRKTEIPAENIIISTVAQ